MLIVTIHATRKHYIDQFGCYPIRCKLIDAKKNVPELSNKLGWFLLPLKGGEPFWVNPMRDENFLVDLRVDNSCEGTG